MGVILLFLIALLIFVGRLLLPQLEDYRTELEQVLSHYLHSPVHIRSLEATWVGWEPGLRMDGFSLMDIGRDTPSVSFNQALVSIDLLRSLLAGRPVLSNVRLEGLRLILERGTDGRLYLLDRADGGPPIEIENLFAWLFATRSLDLISAELWVRHTGLPPLVFSDLRLSLRDEKLGKRLGVAMDLPESLGRRLQGVVDLQGTADDPDSWSAAFYIRGDKLRPAGWPSAMAPASGRVSAEVWGDWQGQEITKVMGQAHSWDLLPPDLWGDGALYQRLRQLPELSTQFSWRRTDRGWRWKSLWRGNDTLGKVGLRAQVDLSAIQGIEGDLQQLNGLATDLRLEDIAAAITPWLNQAQRTLLGGLAPQGEIPELRFDLALGDKAPRYTLAARFTDLSVRPREGIPGLKGLDGNLFLDQNDGQLDLDAESVQVNTDLLRAPILIDTLTGPLYWQRQDATLHLSSSGLRIANADLRTRLQGSVVLFDGGTSPLVDIRLDYRDLKIGKVPTYLPAAILRPQLVKWLDGALVSGRGTVGNMLLRGHLADFPFAQKQGMFEARLQLQDTILDYGGTNWPRIEELEAELVFRNDTFRVQAVAGKIFDVDLQQLDARIESLRQGQLVVRGHARGPTDAMLRFLNQSPLAGQLGAYLRDVEARGDNALTLDLAIPFDGSPVQVKGRVNFDETTLILPGWPLSLERIQGAVNFTRTRLTAKGMDLLLHGQPVHLDIDTLDREDGPGEIQFRAHGLLRPETLLGDYANRMVGMTGQSPLLQGQSYWDLLLSVPTAHLSGPEGLLLSLYSDLEGMAVNLPPPFGKSPGDKRALTAHIKVDEADRLLVRLDYDPDIQAVLELVDFSRQPRFTQGELRINAGPADLPKSRGLNVVARLAHFELPILIGGVARTTADLSWLSTIDAQLDELIIRGLSFPQVHLKVRNQGEDWAVDLQGKSLAGRIYIPNAPSAEIPVGVELQYLTLHRDKTKKVNSAPMPKPGAFPPLWMTVEDLVLDDHSLGRLRLSITPHDSGLKLNVLELDSDLHHLTAKGDWLVTGEDHLSRLQANLHSKELGETLQAFGYPVGLERGETEARLTASWPAPLPRFSVNMLSGELSLHIDKGQLLQVKPGVGRVMGLFSLHSLSRRLALDFSDLFQEGLAFDRIDGTFSIRDGHAHTRDLTLKGPSARIDINGRIGLAERDYDQIVTVTPRVSSTLPIAGTIVGGPAVGAALFLAERILRQEIDQVTRYQYVVTGPWSDPVVKPIRVPVGSIERPDGYNRR